MIEKLTIEKTVSKNMADTEARVRDVLQKHGFGVLTEIDVKATLKKKLDADFKPFKILGACNPPFAHKALLEDERVSLLMPCNVTLSYESEEKTRILAMDPKGALMIAKNPNLEGLAEEVSRRMHDAMDEV